MKLMLINRILHVALVAFTLPCLGNEIEATKKPNVLLLFGDDLGRYASAYADPQVPSPNDLIQTPVFDRIAKEGALFQHAFVSVPSCTPSRAALITGRHFFRNGSHSQLHHPWQQGVADPFEKIKGMPITLRDGGYHIGLSLKLHMRPTLYGRENLYNKAGQSINGYSRFVSQAADQKAAREKVMEEVRQNFRTFLSKRKKDQPFFYSFNPTNTHRVWMQGSGKALWGINPDELKGRMPPTLPDVPAIREDLADYLGEVMAFDAACGEIIRIVEEIGELDQTIVAISGDHGIPGFSRGKCNVHDFGSAVPLALRWPQQIAAKRVVKAPVSLIDLAPTFLAAAGLSSPDDPNGQNILPALKTGGTDASLRGWALIGREVHVAEARSEHLPYPVRALRTADFLYIKNFKPERWPMGDPMAVTATTAPSAKQVLNNTRIAFADIDMSPTKAWLVEHRNDPEMARFIDFAWSKRPAEELYDVKKDPHQLNNLASDPQHAETLKKLREQLMTELKNNNDPRLLDNAFDRAPYRVVRPK